MGNLFQKLKSLKIFRFAAAFPSVSILLNSCIITPLPDPGPGNFSDEIVERIVPCESVAEDIVEILGEPTSIWGGNHIYFYHEGLSGGAQYFAISQYGGDSGTLSEHTGSDLLLIRFDSEWRTLKVYRETGPTNLRMLGDFLIGWNERTLPDIDSVSCDNGTVVETR